MKGEQISMALDTELEASINAKTLEMIDEVKNEALANMIHIRNRHEAYGIAAENMVAVNGAVKAIKNDVNTLLETLPDPNRPAVEAVSAIRNSAGTLVIAAIKMAAIMDRVLRDLYNAEESDNAPEHFPMDDLTNYGFEEAEPTEE